MENEGRVKADGGVAENPDGEFTIQLAPSLRSIELAPPPEKGEIYDFLIEEITSSPKLTIQGEIKGVKTVVSINDPTLYEVGEVVQVVIVEVTDTKAYASLADKYTITPLLRGGG